jgi:colanic acid/amylovoran biosynthesis glycosyltransferase
MGSPKRIAYLVSQYPALNHSYILREIRELRRSSWDVEVASIRADARPVAQLTEEEREERLRTWYVKPQGVTGALRAHFAALTTQNRFYFRGMRYAMGLDGLNFAKTIRNLFYFTEALLIGQWMQKCALRHVHIHFASTVGLLLAKTFPVSISITIHGPAEFEQPEGFHLREKIEAAEFVCTISDYGRTQLMKSCDSGQFEKLETVRLGIDPEQFVAKPRTPLDRSVFEVISVGRLAPEKAQRVLIDAVAHLVGEGRRVRLRIVGEGPERSALEKHIADTKTADVVRLEGALNQDQLKTLYRESDAFALASFAEGVPVVLMEAMAMEIPCVATRIAGIPELIQDGVDGLLATPGNTGEMATALAKLMGDRELRVQIGRAGRQKIIEKYNLSKNTALLAEVFERRVPGE